MDLIATKIAECGWSHSFFLIFSKNIEFPLIYYSHLTAITILLSLLVISFVQLRAPYKSSFRLLLIAYIAWLSCDLVLWANEVPDNIMFFWSMLLAVEPLIYIGGFWMFVNFVLRRDLKLFEYILITLVVIPTFVMIPTHLSLPGFDLRDCFRNAIEGFVAYFNYFTAFLLMGLTGLYVVLAIFKWRKESKAELIKISLYGGSILLMSFSFWLANFIGTVTEEYQVSQYGHIGVPIFATVLAFVILKYESNNTKILGVDVMVFGLFLLFFSMFFVNEFKYIKYVLAATLIVSAPLAWMLMRSVRKEIQTSESLRKLTDDLEHANTQLENANNRLKELDQMKSEFLSIASHQLRAPITAVRGYAANINEGEYGKVPKHLKEPLETVQESARLMAQSIEDYLNISRIEQGRMKYEKSNFDFVDLGKKVVTELSPIAEKKKLKLSIEESAGQVTVNADIGKIKQVLTDLIDNAIKYTQKGSISVHIEKKDAVARLTISDTGVGIAPEEIGQLFEKFKRTRDANKVNTTGTGLGLYVAKQLVEGNNGKIWVESDGLGKGSRFIVELPAI